MHEETRPSGPTGYPPGRPIDYDAWRQQLEMIRLMRRLVLLRATELKVANPKLSVRTLLGRTAFALWEETPRLPTGVVARATYAPERTARRWRQRALECSSSPSTSTDGVPARHAAGSGDLAAAAPPSPDTADPVPHEGGDVVTEVREILGQHVQQQAALAVDELLASVAAEEPQVDKDGCGVVWTA